MAHWRREEDDMSATIESVRTETGDIFADPWQGFAGGRWPDQIDVRDFIQANVTPYDR